MANFFDQFDTQPAEAAAAPPPVASGNFFDQFDERPMPEPGPGVNTTIRPNAKQPEKAQEGSYGQNLGRQAMQGVTFGFADEIGAGLGALKALLTDEEYGDLYNKILERNRAQDKQFSEENPVASTAAQIAGGLATAPFTPALQAARGAGLGARMAAGMTTAGGYGALYGAGTGEGIEDRAEKAAGGAAFGAAAGAAVPAIGAGLRAAGGALAAPFRGAISVDREAARRLGQGFDMDGKDIASAQRALDMGQQMGVPLIVADTGGETVRALARSAANTSTQARERLQQVTADRAKEQGFRVKRLLQSITGASEDSEGVMMNLRRQADAANDPAYKAAYRAPSAQAVWTPELEQLATSTTFQQAMRSAERIARDDAALKGFPPIRQPFNFNADGTVSLKPGVVPNLQFWDYVHRALQRRAETASKKSRSEAAQIGDLDRQLKDHLDIIVPEFGQARAGAAAFFGARDAGEVGAKMVMGRMDKAAVQRGWNAMKPAEKAYAREMYANEFLRMVGETGRLPRMTPQRIERMEIILGPQGARKIAALASVENLMAMTKQAISGNSTTARQLMELGLAGGIGAGYGLQSGDWTTGAIIGAAIKGGTRYIDTRVARRLGEMVASDDPKVLDKAVEMVARDKRLMEAVRNAEARLARALAPTHPDVSRVIGGAADESNEPRGNGGR